MQYKWTALRVTTVGTIMAGIDTRILIVGLLSVARALGADVESIVWMEARSPAPLLDLRLFKIREFTAGNIA